MNGEIQRAELFKKVDELTEQRKEIRAWMDSIEERIDVYNRRVRKLEKLAKMQGGELRAIIQRMNDEKN